MTFSLLVHDHRTRMWCGAAATGNLCVGGWVLHGHATAGIVASQGHVPSPLWAEDVLGRLKNGHSAQEAIDMVAQADSGRGFRQIAAIDAQGRTGTFTGVENGQWHGVARAPGLVAAGNILAGPGVLDALVGGFHAAAGSLPERMVPALRAAACAGGDTRGLMSAALLAVGPTMPPLTLRIDLSDDPVTALEALLHRAMEPSYQDWLDTVPTERRPEGAPGRGSGLLTSGAPRR